MEIKFYEMGEIEDSLLKYAVIVAQYEGKWVFCKNKTRKWEVPGGHRKKDESIENTAKRELFEETGAVEFEIKPICVYSIHSYGLLFYANISKFGDLPESEIERISFFEEIPDIDALSFPLFHPKHIERVKKVLQLA